MDRVRVSIRARPAWESEERCWSTEPRRMIGSRGCFTFDRVFGEESLNDEIFEDSVQDIVKDVMRGYHGAVIAYGQTSTGKTHTMQGTADEPGLIPLAIEACFEHIAKCRRDLEYGLRISYVEVYNESIRDLLSDREPRLHDNGLNCHKEKVASVQDVFDAVVRGEAKRAVAETVQNPRSSRSHALLMLDVEIKGTKIHHGTISFVDLAGSERAAKNRARESAYINKSLHSLALVVSKLTGPTGNHVPYRDSKLTRLLKPALSGKSRCAIVCTVSLSSLEETNNTLHFATRAKKIPQSPAPPVTLLEDQSQLAKYKKEVEELKAQLMQEKARTDDQLAVAVQHLERLIVKSGTKEEAPPKTLAAPAASRFFANSEATRRRRKASSSRSRTLPPQPLQPMLPIKRSNNSSENLLKEEETPELVVPLPNTTTTRAPPLDTELLRVKNAIEEVLATRSTHPQNDLQADLDRARDDTAFVLQQLDKVQAENSELKKKISRLDAIVQAREAEILALKGLKSSDEEMF